MNLYRTLGVQELINAEGTITRLGGCVMEPAVVNAMAATARIASPAFTPRFFERFIYMPPRVCEKLYLAENWIR